MKRLVSFLLLVVLYACSPGSGLASDLTLFAGLQRPGKITLKAAAATATAFTFDPKNFGVVGLRIGIGKKAIGNESTFAYSPNFIDSSAKAIILNSNLIAQVPTTAVKPYVTAGFGTIITKGSGALDIGTKFALNYGAGVKVTVAGPLGVRLDARNYLMPSVQSQKLNTLEVTLGVVFSY